ncbi:hypothetical protein PFISCL1PPCAC_4471, partial [Pristionchus fissidentatus]
MELGPIILIVIADVLIVVTLPVQFRFFYVLCVKNTRELDSTYRLLSTHLTAFNIIVAVIYCLELELASHGAFPAFFKVCIVMALINTFHLLIGMNRFTAIAMPTAQHL